MSFPGTEHYREKAKAPQYFSTSSATIYRQDLEALCDHIEEQDKALEAARHVLVTLHGLVAYDGAAPDYTWTLDTRATIKLIDEALDKEKLENQGEE